jgi:hypothetical protein
VVQDFVAGQAHSTVVSAMVLTYLPGSVALSRFLPRTGTRPPLPKTAASRYNYRHARELAAYFRPLPRTGENCRAA